MFWAGFVKLWIFGVEMGAFDDLEHGFGILGWYNCHLVGPKGY